MAEVHDCFTPTELVLMEDLGFAERGMGWKEVLAGTFDLDGELPVNPDGGLKSFGHPIGASGLRMLFECWLQLRGEAGDRQIAIASSRAARPRRSPTTSVAARAPASASSASSARSSTDDPRDFVGLAPTPTNRAMIGRWRRGVDANPRPASRVATWPLFASTNRSNAPPSASATTSELAGSTTSSFALDDDQRSAR